ncbi:MAG: hypothetical protein GF401_20250 [Chitinivibrionales bacterium]|nr:hypothetical protein [Chitinivibrionales bacterium]
MTINGSIYTNFDDSLVTFPAPLAPFSGEYTPITIHYVWEWDPPLSYRDSGDYVVTIHNSSAPSKTLSEQGLSKECWEQGTLSLYYDSSAVTTVQPQWTSLETRFYPPEEIISENITLLIYNAASSDSLVLTPTDKGAYYSAPFTRQIGPSAFDNVLQNDSTDSIIVIYRNDRVPLDTVRMTAPIITTRDLTADRAFYLDRNEATANGYPDRIRVELGDMLFPDELALLNAQIQTDTTVRGFSIDTILSHSTGFDIILTEPADGTKQPYTGLLDNERLYVDAIPDLPRGGSLPAIDIAILDSMAPVIISATFYDYVSSSTDTMVVIFSEDIDTISDAQPFTLTRNAQDFLIRLASASAESTTAVFAYAPLVGQTDPSQGDLIRINPAASVSDNNTIAQTNASNLQQTLEYYLLYGIRSARYIDTNADGLIDTIDVVTDSIIDQTMLTSLVPNLYLPAHRKFDPVDINDVSIAANGFTIAVSQPASNQPFTGVDNRDILTVHRTQSSNNGVIPSTETPITDSIAPVIVRAVYTPGFAEADDIVPPDTLAVTFSKSVPPLSSTSPFIISAPEGTLYITMLTTITTQSDSVHRFIVDSISEQPGGA